MASVIISPARQRRARLVELVERAQEAGVRLLVATEQLLDSGARRRQRDPRAGIVRQQLDALEQRGARLGEMAGRRLGAGERRQQLDALLRRGGVAEQPQGRREPARRACRRALRGLLAGLAENCDGVAVALRGGALEVVRACRRRRAARGQRLGASLMGAETPAAGRGFVDRAADERVPEAKAARHICGADEIAAQELVERLDRRRRVDARRRRHQLGLERVAGHRRSFEHPAGLRGEQRELLGERRGHRGRHLDAPDGRARG